MFSAINAKTVFIIILFDEFYVFEYLDGGNGEISFFLFSHLTLFV